MQKLRAEECFEARGSDSNVTDYANETEGTEDRSNPEFTAEDRAQHGDTPRPPRAKIRKSRSKRNLERQMVEAQLLQINFHDSDLTMSEKDDSDFGSEASLSDTAAHSEEERGNNSACANDSLVATTDGDSQTSDESSDDILQNPLLYPPSQPIRYDQVTDTELDPDMEFFRAVTALKVRHEVSDAVIKVSSPF